MDAVVKLFKAQAESEERARKARDGKTARSGGKRPGGQGAGRGETGRGETGHEGAGGMAGDTAPALLPDGTPRPSRAEAEAAVKTLLAYLGEDPAREGLVDTPQRVVRAYDELFAGYGEDADELLARTFGEIGSFDDFVLLRDIPFHSHCEHHMVPFYGKAHVAYFPVERVVGLSKIARVVDIFARRLQTQEHLTSQIVTTLDEGLRPRGVAVMIEAEHMCMSMRGITKPGVSTLTSQFTGAFRDDPAEQVRFMTMVRARG